MKLTSPPRRAELYIYIFNFLCAGPLALTNLFTKVRGLKRPQVGKYRQTSEVQTSGYIST